MNNKEHLALFILGVGTLGITFLLLLALGDKNNITAPAVDKHIQVSEVQAAIEPATQIPKPPSTESFDRDVAETFAKTTAYLGRGKFEEQEHIALLERLEFYAGMSSIKPQHKEKAQNLIKDMDHLLTLKDSVARQIKLSGQINAVETEVQIHIAKGERNEAEARKLKERIESLYSLQGLTEDQNRKLRNSLASLNRAYKPAAKNAENAPAPTGVAAAPKAQQAEPPVTKSEVRPNVEAKPVPNITIEKASPAKTTTTAVKTDAITTTKPVTARQDVASVNKARPSKVNRQDSQVFREYNKVMTYVSSYFVARVYDEKKHAKLTADLEKLAKNSASLGEREQESLKETIAKMKRIDENMRK